MVRHSRRGNRTKPRGLSARVARLEEIEALKQLKAQYARACDPTHQVDVLMALFAEDAVFDVGEKYGVYGGKAAIRQFLESADKIIPWALHNMVSPIIEVAPNGRTAWGQWYLLELATMPHPRTGKLVSVWIAGTYNDEFVKEDGEWRFKRIVLRMQIMAPHAEGWAKRPWLE